jgi:pimeloyl-ACP methyl ester carboxylesterase
MPEFRCKDSVLHYEQFGKGADIVWISGGSSLGRAWHEYQIPYFKQSFRNTTYDARGIGQTKALKEPPWTIEKDFAVECIELIEGVCNPPVFLVGLSMGSFTAQQVCIERPDLVRCAVVMGTAARSTGFLYDWMRAEIDLRLQGGAIGGMFALTHYAAFCYPASVLGDDEAWDKIKKRLETGNRLQQGEQALVPQWEACLYFDCLDRLKQCQVPIHVVAFSEDLQTPPSRGKEVADTAPQGHFHLFEGMGHVSIYGHMHDVLNPFIKGIVDHYL